MLGLSALMISNISYPSFKKIDFQTRGTFLSIIAGAIVIVLLLNENTRWYTPTIIFSLYLLYGLIRPLLSKNWQQNIEHALDSENGPDEQEP